MESDLPSAIEWGKELPAGKFRQRVLIQLSPGWIERDPLGALAFAGSLPLVGADDHLLHLVAGKVAEHDAGLAATWLAEQPDGPRKARMTSTILMVFAREAPEPAATYAQDLPPGEVQTQVAASVAASWAQQNSAAAAAWSMQLPAGRTREYALEVLASSWVRQDPSSLVVWLGGLTPGRERNVALNAAAGALSKADPQIATMLADSIGDADLRRRQFTRAAEHWLATDRPAATAWLATADMPPTIKNLLRPGM